MIQRSRFPPVNCRSRKRSFRVLSMQGDQGSFSRGCCRRIRDRMNLLTRVPGHACSLDAVPITIGRELRWGMKEFARTRSHRGANDRAEIQSYLQAHP
jgi:hypothetical protein